jgi:two-component system sensor histidine kinase YesM
VLVIEVRDDGRGMHDPGGRARGEPSGSGRRRPESLHRIGIGIANVERRIALNFGAPYGLEIESEPGAFTLVRYILPALERIELPGEARSA